jgi:hypothetical protein
MWYEFMPRSARSMMRVQGNLLRHGDKVDLQRPPRKAHLRSGLRLLVEEPAPWEQLEGMKLCQLAWTLGAQPEITAEDAKRFLSTQDPEKTRGAVKGWGITR